MRAALLLLFAACGSEPTQPPAIDAPAGCEADFSGNFAETSSLAASCPTLANGTLAFAIPIATFDATLDASIDLPAIMAGSYSSETVASWSASAFEPQTNGGCAFRAGNSASPEGSFTLQLASIAPLHGSFVLSLSVLTAPGSSCGTDDVESLAVTF